MHWLAHWLGLDNSSGPIYAFWSGVGSDLGEISLVGIFIALVRGRNCEVPRCWRFGRHQTAGSGGVVHKVCRRHHPEGAPTYEHLLRHHHRLAEKTREQS